MWCLIVDGKMAQKFIETPRIWNTEGGTYYTEIELISLGYLPYIESECPSVDRSLKTVIMIDDIQSTQVVQTWSITDKILTQDEIVEKFRKAVQKMLDDKVKERQYYNILSACTYATSTIPVFKAEGQACVEWRDLVWATSYDLLAKALRGEIPIPTIDELIVQLPQLTWPT